MKVLHASYSVPPDPAGGTEIYVQGLCDELVKHAVESVIAAPGDHDETFEHHGQRIRRFLAPTPNTLDQIYGAPSAEAARQLGALLDEEMPDVLHQHALTPACSSELARQAKRRGVPVVFTYHTPAVSCQRGTMMHWGREACDGRLEVARCAACTLEGLGAGSVESRMLGHLPVAAGRFLGSHGASGGAWTALRMSSLLALRHDEVRAMFDLADQIVVLAPWVAGVLRANGVSAAKLTESPHGVGPITSPRRAGRPQGGGLRLAHLGRVDPIKGTRLLLDALRAAPRLPLTLDVFGVTQHATDREALADLQQVAGEDARIVFHAPIPHDSVTATLAAYDLVVVPSQGMETGPLVVLEAFAAGVPVLGSALGGIADKVRHGDNGWLVRPHDSVDAWTAALTHCAVDVEAVRKLSAGVRAPRLMPEVAREMFAVYSRLTATTGQPAAHTAAGRH